MKMDCGDSMARNTIADPYAAPQNRDPMATLLSNGATFAYLPEYSKWKSGPRSRITSAQYVAVAPTDTRVSLTDSPGADRRSLFAPCTLAAYGRNNNASAI